MTWLALHGMQLLLKATYGRTYSTGFRHGQDSRVAMGYGPKTGGRCSWARALAAHSAALEGLHVRPTPHALFVFAPVPCTTPQRPPCSALHLILLCLGVIKGRSCACMTKIKCTALHIHINAQAGHQYPLLHAPCSASLCSSRPTHTKKAALPHIQCAATRANHGAARRTT